MPRLFAGLEIPHTIRSRLALKQAGMLGVRWIDPSDFHITLRFIGDVDTRTASNVIELLSDQM
jgi:2'-5' RNA ligase